MPDRFHLDHEASVTDNGAGQRSRKDKKIAKRLDLR